MATTNQLIINTCSTFSPMLLLLIPFTTTFIIIFITLYRTVKVNKVNLPVNFPVVGMLPNFWAHLDDLHDYFTDVLRDSNWTLCVKGPWFLNMDMVITCDPSNVNHVFNTNFSDYPKGDDFVEFFDTFSNSMLTTNDDTWRRQRNLTHSLMSNRSLRAYEYKFNRDKVEDALVPILRTVCAQGRAVDLQDVFVRLTFDTTCAIILGMDSGSLTGDFPVVPFAKAMDDALEAIFYRHLMPRFLWKAMRLLDFGPEKKLTRASKVMDEFVTQSIAKRKLKSTNCTHYDLYAAFLSLPEQKVTSAEFDKFIRNNALSLMLAGKDTTAATLTWFFWVLSLHLHVEQKILEELEANWPKECTNSSPFGHEDLSKLVYLHAALCECLRLYPPVALQHKGAAKADVLPSGQVVQPRTPLIFHVYSMARMEGIWGEDCAEFRPERWITENGELKREPAHKFFAFNCGPRYCIGKDMAFNKMKVVIAAILYNFKVRVIEGHVVKPKLSVVSYMKNGLMVKLTERERKSWFLENMHRY